MTNQVNQLKDQGEMKLARNTVRTVRTSHDGVSHGKEQTSRARHFETDIRLARVGYPTCPSRISNSAETDIRLREDGYPTRRGRIADFVDPATRIDRLKGDNHETLLRN